MRNKEDLIDIGKRAIALEDAVSILKKYAHPVREHEHVPLISALGRILAEDITAGFDQPPFPRSPLDGYAIRAEDTIGANKETPARLTVIAEVDAGQYYEGVINKGEAVRIMTGAPIPEGADAVAGQEDTDFGEDIVSIYYEFSSYQNYCHRGEDYKKGHVLLRERDCIGPAEAGIIASTGRSEINVYRKPRVLLISTGDEIAEPGHKLDKGKIYDSNLYTLYAQLDKWGIDIVEAFHLSDEADCIEKVIDQNIEDVDLIITSGGVSVGKKDVMHDVYKHLEVDKLVHNVKLKPGKAMLAGLYKEKMIVSLSGNPFAAYADMHMVVKPIIAALQGSKDPAQQRMKATMAEDYCKSSPVRRLIRAMVIDGVAYIEGHTGGNGTVYSGHNTNAFIDVPQGTDSLSEGDVVDVIML